MKQALKNTQDAMAMLNTADGALNEQAEILQRMRELVLQAKNDTLTSVERGYIGKELNALINELDRIAAVTNYNGMRLFAAPEALEGEGQGRYSVSNPNPTDGAKRIVDGRDIWDDGNEADNVFGRYDYSSAHYFNMMIGANFSNEDDLAENDESFRYSFDETADNLITVQIGQMDANALLSANPGIALGNVVNTDTHDGTFEDLEWNSDFPGGNDKDPWLSLAFYGGTGQGSVHTKLDYLLDLIDGNTSDIPDHLLTRGNLDPKNPTQRPIAVTGLDRVNRMRGAIGATINRLQHTSNNLVNQINNTQAAETLIRDADFALESTQYSRNAILTQSATAMLAQANVSQQAVMGLLQ
jgi:flagellin